MDFRSKFSLIKQSNSVFVKKFVPLVMVAFSGDMMIAFCAENHPRTPTLYPFSLPEDECQKMV